jgi:transcriptional regulator NrdR family protein
VGKCSQVRHGKFCYLTRGKVIEQHTLTLQEDEFRLVQNLRQVVHSEKIKKELIDKLIQQIQDFLASQPQTKTIKWLQVGALKHFRQFDPVTPEPEAPLASDIIIAQRGHPIYSSPLTVI